MSVVTITFNHEAFIRETLDGFVAQKTDFPVEVIVGDDASTDNTPAIISEYAERHPHLFRPILRSKNIGPYANLTDTLSASRGEYLALCDGDDYWTDPMKLSKQVAFLDRHPEKAVCFHPVRVIWEDGRPGSEFPPPGWRRDLSVNALIKRNFIQTNSVLYRRLPRYDDIPVDVMPMDWYLHVRHAARGGIGMLPETMSVYRRHPQGVWYNADADRKKFWVSHGGGHVAMFEAMLDVFPDDAVREELIAGRLDWILREIARVPGPEGRAALLETIAHHPRSAMLALQHRWRSPTRRLRSLWRKRAPSARAR
ncbi:sugar transferase [Mycobacterium scrofulaceum]|uniref:glycosyltransferase n=1 Tax=Mycobacterium scrofulaceum TaxID=1783 RepID=UPI0007FF0684|nr:glycosyltransferase [Mycobacterium scrofulaceum]OBH79301.1 sugar transferase [Mycobacterium scrofulaceum]